VLQNPQKTWRTLAALYAFHKDVVMPKQILSEDDLIQILRDALKSVGNSPLLADGVARDELLGMRLDTVLATNENLEKLVNAIKTRVTNRGGKVLLGKATIKATGTFGDLLNVVRARQVVN